MISTRLAYPQTVVTDNLVVHGLTVLTDQLWRTHSCVPRRDSSRRKDAELVHSVHTSVNAARTSACATYTITSIFIATTKTSQNHRKDSQNHRRPLTTLFRSGGCLFADYLVDQRYYFFVSQALLAIRERGKAGV